MACCLNCPDRIPFPNCHTTCEKYLNEKKEIDERREFLSKESKLGQTIGSLNDSRKFKRNSNGIIGKRH